MTKLIERARVKDVLQIARADSLYDGILGDMIEQISSEAEDYCRRKFKKQVRTDFLRSYDQYAAEPDPQYLWLDGPVDTDANFVITFATNMMHDTAGVTLADTDYRLDHEQGLVRVYGASGLSNSLVGLGFSGRIFSYCADGFRVQYTGGYDVISATPDPYPNPDPMDDYDVVNIPSGLRNLLLTKVAEDFTQAKRLLTWSDEQHKRLRPWQKKDVL